MPSESTSKRLDLTAVRNAVIEDVFPLLDSLNLEYRQEGDNIFMCCPAHVGSDNPNGCSLSLKYKRWHCWTHGCHEEYGKDIFGFIKGALQTDSFSEVLRHLSKTYSLRDKEDNHEKKAFEDELGDVVKWFRPQEDKIPPNPIIPVVTCGRSKYFESRGFSEETLKVFGVEDCEDKTSPMKMRSIIPITARGLYVGYIARATREWILPKYLFSEGFCKTDHLYNYDRAMIKALEKNALFIVEGQGDVWRMYESGVTNCVGLFGRSVSEAQEALLVKSGITNLIILTDNDSSGREAKADIKRKLGRMFKLFFPTMRSKDLGLISPDKVRSTILPLVKGYY